MDDDDVRRCYHRAMGELHILIADDHPMVRTALRQALAGPLDGACFLDCSTFDELTALLAQPCSVVDLVLLDLNMPGMQGFVGLMTVQANWPTVPVIMVSACEDQASIAQARRCGASGFIPKSAPMDSVVAAVRTVLDGGIWFETAHDIPGGDPCPPGGDIARRLATLTPQQMRVLQMILEGKLNKQIAGDLDLAEQTVKGHVSQILHKLDLNSRTQVVIAVGPLLTAPLPA
jgi:DNA-binding NarL/FixJ family response regulator